MDHLHHNEVVNPDHHDWKQVDMNYGLKVYECTRCGTECALMREPGPEDTVMHMKENREKVYMTCSETAAFRVHTS